MSKAFVKDDGESELEVENELDPLGSLPSDVKNYMTTEGFKRLKNENEVWLSKLGDQSENQKRVERRLQILQNLIDRAEVIAPENQPQGRVLFGATVTVQDEYEKPHVYSIVGITESDASMGRISWLSPVAKSLLQGKVGDVVTVTTPLGQQEIEILKIEFSPLG